MLQIENAKSYQVQLLAKLPSGAYFLTTKQITLANSVTRWWVLSREHVKLLELGPDHRHLANWLVSTKSSCLKWFYGILVWGLEVSKMSRARILRDLNPTILHLYLWFKSRILKDSNLWFEFIITYITP